MHAESVKKVTTSDRVLLPSQTKFTGDVGVLGTREQ